MGVDTKRLRELIAKGGFSDGLNAAEEAEFDNLADQRRMEIDTTRLHPTCCDASKNYPTIRAAFDMNETSADAEILWRADVSSDQREQIPGLHRGNAFSEWLENYPVPEFCPWCGTGLPDFEKKDPPPEDLCVITDGGYYCDTCVQRLDSCMCWPITYAWKLREDEPTDTDSWLQRLTVSDKVSVVDPNGDVTCVGEVAKTSAASVWVVCSKGYAPIRFSRKSGTRAGDYADNRFRICVHPLPEVT